MAKWGTWEELLLGGAVLRHGTRDWNVVASELRTRTVSPGTFTPEVCKAKYEDLQRHNKAWFEELKNKRVAELKKDLELSESLIGFLESKIESLMTEKNEEKDDCHVENGSVEPELHVSSQKMDRVDSSTKETSKDGLSAGSFTHETQAKRSPSTVEIETKPSEVSRSTLPEEGLNVEKLEHTVYEGQGGGLKRKRGKRKRKECGKNINETSARENNFSADVSCCKESSTSNCAGGEVVKCSGINEENKNLKKDEIKDMMEILDSVLGIQGASSFSHRLDSQKRQRYKKMIRRHMDFDTIRSRISNQEIKSVKELLRDLLLLANNALVFYSETTRGYKSALLIRDFVTKKLRENPNCVSTSITHTELARDPPAIVQSLRSGSRKVVAKADGGSNSASGVSLGAKKPSNVDSPASVDSLPIKKGFGRSKRIGCETVVKEKRRGRAR